MNLSEYIEKLTALKEKYGGDLTLVYSADDEGNRYGAVNYEPAVCEWNAKHREVYFSKDQFEDEREPEINAICIN